MCTSCDPELPRRRLLQAGAIVGAGGLLGAIGLGASASADAAPTPQPQRQLRVAGQTPMAADRVVRPVVFPIERYHSPITDTFGDPRSGGRKHAGNDLMGRKLMHLRSTVDGRITALRPDNTSMAGNSLTIKDDAGWAYVYMHLNNDTPGTDDGRNPGQWIFAPRLAVGQRVRAGQFVGFLGDSGNAESTAPHLHFEIHRPDGVAVTPYPSLAVARR